MLKQVITIETELPNVEAGKICKWHRGAKITVEINGEILGEPLYFKYRDLAEVWTEDHENVEEMTLKFSNKDLSDPDYMVKEYSDKQPELPFT
jgi:hypothetical protein